MNGGTIALKVLKNLISRNITQQGGKMLSEIPRRSSSCRIERETAIAHHERGDALRDFLDPFRLAQTDQIVMAMRVDKAGREIKAACIDGLDAVSLYGLADFRDTPVAQKHIGEEPGRAGAIHNTRFADQAIGRH